MQDDIELYTNSEANIAGDEQLFYAQSGLQTKQIRQLKRGQLPIAARLDLHRLTIDEAKDQFIEFMQHCRQQRFRLVCIIHGKGLHSDGHYAILKSAVNSWLRQLTFVLAFCSAKPVDGGSGAVYVLLKSIKEHRS